MCLVSLPEQVLDSNKDRCYRRLSQPIHSPNLTTMQNRALLRAVAIFVRVNLWCQWKASPRRVDHPAKVARLASSSILQVVASFQSEYTAAI